MTPLVRASATATEMALLVTVTPRRGVAIVTGMASLQLVRPSSFDLSPVLIAPADVDVASDKDRTLDVRLKPFASNGLIVTVAPPPPPPLET
jgi:hypothetical protein